MMCTVFIRYTTPNYLPERTAKLPAILSINE